MKEITNKLKEFNYLTTKLYWTEVFLFGSNLVDKEREKHLTETIGALAENILTAIDNCYTQIDILNKVYMAELPSQLREIPNFNPKKRKESPDRDVKNSLLIEDSEKPS